ncbi:hypothetical protein JOB18_024543 [Solea senegalensis]|uniref:Uncharacterized protein n=1 Tax=Solea senegalensis TaxID=28829 RepID=A0AAV6SKU1_SOLSE|nr:hypothetical protein JOB18_024543 [Solea senegalensis]
MTRRWIDLREKKSLSILFSPSEHGRLQKRLLSMDERLSITCQALLLGARAKLRETAPPAVHLEHSIYTLAVSYSQETVTSSSLSSRDPLNKVTGGRDHAAQFSALSECHNDDLALPLAPVCEHVTIMIRIDDRTF